MTGRATGADRHDVHRRAADLFAARFDTAPDGVWSAPGRANLIGEHVDYSGGLCLPVALPHRTAAAVRRRDDRVVRAVSGQAEEPWEAGVDALRPGDPGGWAAYVAGVLWALGEDGVDVPGVDVAVDSDVPVGAGLSSSAALECAVALAVAELAGLADGPELRRRLATVCVRAENDYVGAPTGGMDQAAALLTTEGHALLLDSQDGATEQVPLPLRDAGLSLLVIDTRASHQLVDGQYADRRDACVRAAELLGVATLRTVADEPDGLDRVARLEDPVLRRRARHAVTEIRRVESVVELLRSGAARDIGPLLDASHESLRHDYEVSVIELDTAVEAARSAGALGARMTGGGFGGSAIALVREQAVERVQDAVRSAFADAELGEPAFLIAVPSASASRADRIRRG